ncbi:DUF3219 family protein [Heyndrickxia ginsengihumi]|nr:DUF3219 family protein [Heyndrickxia ginsengihumi]KHD85472.1 hypothetical protein NG54_08795 [Heyndrickxia ginsengihumi]MBE6183192.1 DUF3219 family protein [Bacillus sp. (in: firmicutes)]MCM3023864.1 YkvR family protein [Heyndrickxia ginsengihumi]
MVSAIKINDRTINITQFQEEYNKQSKYTIRFSFHVKGGLEYHDITALLYNDSFHIVIPDRKRDFTAVIQEYYTSIGDFADEDTTATFTLTLLEI